MPRGENPSLVVWIAGVRNTGLQKFSKHTDTSKDEAQNLFEQVVEKYEEPGHEVIIEGTK